jgi:hypothetical protein
MRQVGRYVNVFFAFPVLGRYLWGRPDAAGAEVSERI